MQIRRILIVVRFWGLSGMIEVGKIAFKATLPVVQPPQQKKMPFQDVKTTFYWSMPSTFRVLNYTLPMTANKVSFSFTLPKLLNL